MEGGNGTAESVEVLYGVGGKKLIGTNGIKVASVCSLAGFPLPFQMQKT